MKKLFAIFACTLLAGMYVARAEDVTVCIMDENEVEYQSIQTTLTRDSEGVYSLDKFVNTSTPIHFKFDESIAVGEKSPVEITDNVKVAFDYYYRVLNSNNKYPKGKIFTADGEEILVRYPCVYDDGTGTYSYVQHLDKETDGYDYVGVFLVTGKDADDEWLDYYDYYFYFNDIRESGVAGLISDNAEEAQYYGIDGRRVDNPEKGIYICRQGSKVKKVIIR